MLKVAIEIPRVEAGQLALLRGWVALAERLGVASAFAAEARVSFGDDLEALLAERGSVGLAKRDASTTNLETAKRLWQLSDDLTDSPSTYSRPDPRIGNSSSTKMEKEKSDA